VGRFPTSPARASGGRLQGGAILAGILWTFGLSVLAAAVLAAGVYLAAVTERSASQALFYAGLTSLAAGAALGARRAEGLGWLHGAAIGCAYVMLSMVVGLILFPGSMALADALHRLAVGLAVGALGGVLGVNL
jgi:putative membrane protein (TIGR04086 family)